MQRVYGEFRIVHGRVSGSKTGALQVGFRADGLGLQIHFQAAIDGSPESADSKLWQD